MVYKERAFGEQFSKIYLSNLEEIRKKISNHSDVFSISEYDIDFDDVFKKLKDSSYLSDLGFEYTSDGIRVLISSSNFWNDIKKYISKTITKLDVPLKMIEDDIGFLSTFPNLHTLIINDGSFISKEVIEAIVNSSSVKEILINNFSCDLSELAKNPGFTVLEYPYNYIDYKGIIIKNIKPVDVSKKVFYSQSVNISSYDLDEQAIRAFYDVADERFKNVVNIMLANGNNYKIELNEDKSVIITLKSNSTKDIEKIYNFLIKSGYTVREIKWNLVDENYYDLDISALEKLAKKVSISINYGKYDASFEDFKGLIECVRFYRNMINDSNLSPTEKVMFAYDILKTFPYQESAVSEMDSRAPHRIIETGNIVCVGYSFLLEEILNQIDENIKIMSFGLSRYDKDGKFREGHERNLIRIDDDKYNIHGVFAFDVTWDSVRKVNVMEAFGEDYNVLDLYRYFLVPASDYSTVFKYDTLPEIFKFYFAKDYSMYALNESCEKLFGKKLFASDLAEPEEDNWIDVFRDYLNAARPSLETLSDMILNVRMAYGYSKEEAVLDVERALKVNMRSIEFNKKNGKEIPFFESKKEVSRL